MKLYLDYNIFSQIKKEVEEKNKTIEYNIFLDSIKNLYVYYTYAHCEELARLKYNKKELLKYYKDITKDNEIIYTAFLN